MVGAPALSDARGRARPAPRRPILQQDDRARPNDLGPEGCGGLAFTAIMSLEDAGDGKTLYRAVAMHRNQTDSETHAKMGFHDGWGTCADQLGEVAEALAQ